MAKKPIQPIKTARALIKGRSWSADLYSKKDYMVLHGPDSEAMCVVDKRCIDFAAGNVPIERVRHEVLHAFVEECHAQRLDLTLGQLEELICEIYSLDFYQLEEAVHAIYDAFKGEKE